MQTGRNCKVDGEVTARTGRPDRRIEFGFRAKLGGFAIPMTGSRYESVIPSSKASTVNVPSASDALSKTLAFEPASSEARNPTIT